MSAGLASEESKFKYFHIEFLCNLKIVEGVSSVCSFCIIFLCLSGSSSRGELTEVKYSDVVSRFEIILPILDCKSISGK